MKMNARVDDLCQAYNERQLTRREFGKRLAALGFSASAIASRKNETERALSRSVLVTHSPACHGDDYSTKSDCVQSPFCLSGCATPLWHGPCYRVCK